MYISPLTDIYSDKLQKNLNYCTESNLSSETKNLRFLVWFFNILYYVNVVDFAILFIDIFNRLSQLLIVTSHLKFLLYLK